MSGLRTASTVGEPLSREIIKPLFYDHNRNIVLPSGLVSERKDSLVNRVKDRGCALLLMPNYQFLQSSEAEFFIAVLPFKNTVAVHHQDRARLETRGSSMEFDVRYRAENHTR